MSSRIGTRLVSVPVFGSATEPVSFSLSIIKRENLEHREGRVNKPT